jgi:hypothetical protein
MLNERQRRRFLAIESKSLGYGGISLISRISGMSRQTLTEGVKELDDPHVEEITPASRIRKAGAGRKPVWEEQPGMLESLEDLVSAHTKGDPMSALLWTNKSLRNLEAGLLGLGYTACHRVVGVMLNILGYGLQADKKTLSITVPHKDRDAPFECINGECKKAAANGTPFFQLMLTRKKREGTLPPTDVPGNPRKLR